jgi:hypothetical protein
VWSNHLLFLFQFLVQIVMPSTSDIQNLIIEGVEGQDYAVISGPTIKSAELQLAIREKIDMFPKGDGQESYFLVRCAERFCQNGNIKRALGMQTKAWKPNGDAGGLMLMQDGNFWAFLPNHNWQLGLNAEGLEMKVIAFPIFGIYDDQTKPEFDALMEAHGATRRSKGELIVGHLNRYTGSKLSEFVSMFFVKLCWAPPAKNSSKNIDPNQPTPSAIPVVPQSISQVPIGYFQGPNFPPGASLDSAQATFLPDEEIGTDPEKDSIWNPDSPVHEAPVSVPAQVPVPMESDSIAPLVPAASKKRSRQAASPGQSDLDDSLSSFSSSPKRSKSREPLETISNSPEFPNTTPTFEDIFAGSYLNEN